MSDDASTDAPAPTTAELFLTFLSIALSGFGGTLPFARRVLVERKGWMTPVDFVETLSFCQSLPGPNVVNMSVVVGARARGWRGSAAAFVGLVGAPVVLVTTLGVLYGHFGGLKLVQQATVGLGAAAAGLVVATAVRMIEPLATRERVLVAVPFVAASFLGVGVLRFPLPYVLLALAPISIAVAWFRRPRV